METVGREVAELRADESGDACGHGQRGATGVTTGAAASPVHQLPETQTERKVDG